VSLDEAAEYARSAGTPSAMVWLLLFYMAWKTRSRTFRLSNEMLALYGVNRWTKYRVLARLAKDAKVEILQQDHLSVTVTLRTKPKLPK
jgi:hypothetical protein